MTTDLFLLRQELMIIEDELIRLQAEKEWVLQRIKINEMEITNNRTTTDGIS